MTDDLDTILRRVAAGEITPEAAEPLVAAAMRGGASGGPESTGPGGPRDPGETAPQHIRPRSGSSGAPDDSAADRNLRSTETARRAVRLQVVENGRPVVNLRMPMSWAGLAGNVLPGLSPTQADRIRDAIRSGEIGTLLEVRDEDGDGVIISTE